MDCREKSLGPGCTRNTCATISYNPKTTITTLGGVGEDTMSLSSTDGRLYLLDVDMRRYSFACGLLNDLLTDDASKLLVKTPLVINPVFLTSLLSINNEGKGGTMISTMTYYTVLHSAIYKAFVGDFVKEAAAKKMKRVGSVAPFGACFSSENIKNTMNGPAVPIIDLVVKGNNAPWRINFRC
ncbi:hypothetical protein Dsin_029523 [Dipteronia sinensis]|uniref:Xylanase inhibitor C-terminal domain-containing protein n=1 Tax=Dipteronia sinensis TaxID=43782 RepID=A0AAD9ZSU9_9ROSI|nr:hypothetical protein Dsin_029523 [Dipteronia sinensis]